MPRASDTTKPITLYPLIPEKEKIEALAAEQGESANRLVLAWVRERPEMQGDDE